MQTNALLRTIQLTIKDLKVALVFLVISLPLFLTYAASFFITLETTYIFMNVLFTLFLAVGITIIDHKYTTDILYCSLPVQRSWIVTSKYLLAVICLLVGLAVCYGFGFFLDTYIDPEMATLDQGLIRETLPLFVFSVLILTGLFYPFYFRYGYGKALIAFFIFIICLTIVMGGISYLIGLVTGGTMRRNLLAVLVQLVNRIRISLVYPVQISLGSVLSTGIFVLSIRISTHFYRKREF